MDPMAAKFEGIDFYDIDSLLSEEERMVRDTIRDWRLHTAAVPQADHSRAR
jgi:glutaryl-CoA dehydrogenase